MKKLSYVLFFILAIATVAIWFVPFLFSILSLARDFFVTTSGRAIAPMGMLALPFAGIAWLSFLLFMIDYYIKGFRKKRLFNSFFTIAAVEMFLLPFLHLARIGIYRAKPDWFDFTMGIGGLVLGTAFTVFAYRTSPRRSRARIRA
jgi:hypothetical protein